MIITVAILVNIIAIGTQVEKDHLYRLGKKWHNYSIKQKNWFSLVFGIVRYTCAHLCDVDNNNKDDNGEHFSW